MSFDRKQTVYHWYTATDNDGNKVKKELSVMLGLKDYDVMYFADVNTDEELNSDLYGIPMEAVKKVTIYSPLHIIIVMQIPKFVS